MCWSDGVLTERLLEELLVDRRDGRKGFSAEITLELVRLHELHEQRLTGVKTEPAPGPAAQVIPSDAWSSMQATADR